MANYCEYCGSPLQPGSKFCTACGAAVNETDAEKTKPEIKTTVQPAQQRPVQTVRTQAPANNTREEKTAVRNNKTRKSAGRRGLSLFLALILFAELGVAGFKYPGFLRTKTDPTDPFDTDDKYSDEDYDRLIAKNASGEEAGVTIEEVEQLVQQLKSELSDEDFRALSPGAPDTIDIHITKEEIASVTPEKADVSPESPICSAGGVTVDFKSWNLSGADTLEVRDLGTKRDDSSGSTLHPYDFSLESGVHEFPTEVEITIPRPQNGHANGVVWYNTETRTWEPVAYDISEDGLNYIAYISHFTTLSAAESDSVTESVRADAGIFCTGLTAEEKADMQPEKMYQIALSVSDEKLAELYNVPEENKKVLHNTLKSVGIDLNEVTNSTFFKIFGAVDTTKTHINIVDPDFWGSYGKKYFAPISALSTTLSVITALEDGDTVKEVLKDQGLNITASIIGLAAFLPVSAPVAIGCAAVSVVLFWAPSIADALKYPSFGDVENTYRYYLDSRWNYKGDPLRPDGSGWADQIEHLMKKAKAEKGAKSATLIEDYFKKYVRSFWDGMSSYSRSDWQNKYYKFQHTPNALRFRWKDPSDERKEQMIAKVDQMLHEHTASILRAAYRKERNEMMVEYKKLVENTLLKYMNSYITIDVADNALEHGTFDKSVYARGPYPMSFKKVNEKPEFWPYDMSEDDYYPDAFCPYVHENSDRVFACRIYYYVMFGKPDTIVFEGEGDLEPVELQFEVPANQFGAIPIKLSLQGEAEQKPQAAAGKICKIGDNNADKFIHTEMNPDEDSAYGSLTATVSVDSKLNVTVNIPSIGRRINGYYEDSWDMVNMSGLSFTAQADPGAEESYREDGEWTCSANLSGRTMSSDNMKYEKSRLSYEYHTTARLKSAELSCIKEGSKIYVEVEIVYDATIDEYYHSYTEYGQDEKEHKEREGLQLYWEIYGE